MGLKHNSVGLLRLNRRPTVFNAAFAYATLKSEAMVYPDPLGRVYEVKEGDMLGRRQFQLDYRSGIGRKHVKVLAIDGTLTDNPTILLEVNGQGAFRNRHLKMRVFHHRLRPGDESITTNFIDLTRREHHSQGIGSPSTFLDGQSVRVAIGDTLELSNNLRRSTYFGVVGISVAGDRTLNGLVTNSIRDGILDRLQFLPSIHAWFDRRGEQLERLSNTSTDGQNAENRILSQILDNKRQTLDTMYRVIQLNPAAIQKSAPPIRVNPTTRLLTHNFETTLPRGERFVPTTDRHGVAATVWGGARIDHPKQRRAEDVAMNARQAYIDHQAQFPVNGSIVRWRMQPAAGLQNPRGKNLCYINAVAQLLRGMKCTRELFLMGRFWSGHDLSSARKFAEFGEKGGFVACALQQLFNRMQFRNGRPIATALKDSLLMNSSFADFDNDLQQDATEFLGLVLCVLTEILRKNGRDPISSLFCSPVISWVRCSECAMHRENFSDESIILHVPIIGTTIQDSLLHGFFEQERIDEWICDNQCNSHGTKGLSLESRNILVLSLKRFPNHGRKDDTLVTFPLDGLDTAPFMHRPDEFRTTYKLVAVINHIGNSLSRGHYTLSMRFGPNTWYNYDDESVRLISSAEVVTKHAYTLVYCLSNKFLDLISHEETAS